jgi:hypothetical protein
VRIFHFLNSNSNFEFGPVENWSGPVGPVPTVSGPVPTGSVNPGCGCCAPVLAAMRLRCLCGG